MRLHRRSGATGALLLILAAALAGCSDDDPTSPAPATLAPGEIPLVRSLCVPASPPILTLGAGEPAPTFAPADRVATLRWFTPRERVLARYLNPDLVGEDRGESVWPVIDLFLRDDEGGAHWREEAWGGVMLGLPADRPETRDLSGMAFLEVWVNDHTVDPEDRVGRLHIDFGVMDEDAFWAEEGGEPVVGVWDQEDGSVPGEEPDGVFVPAFEDVGLPGYAMPFDATYGSADDPYPAVNGLRENMREDTEDIDGDGVFNRGNGYWSVVIDLKETPAFVDVAMDYPPSEVAELVAMGLAWRLYRLPILTAASVADGAVPDRRDVRHVRVWFEAGHQWNRATCRLQIARLRFL